MINEIISGVCVFAFLMLLHYAPLAIKRLRKTRHYEIVGHTPSGTPIILPDKYRRDADGIIVRIEP